MARRRTLGRKRKTYRKSRNMKMKKKTYRKTRKMRGGGELEDLKKAETTAEEAYREFIKKYKGTNYDTNTALREQRDILDENVDEARSNLWHFRDNALKKDPNYADHSRAREIQNAHGRDD